MTPMANTRDRARLRDTRGLAWFTALVALLAILSDAAVGHALLWENDPYWTYWITKTFLIATVFGLGTAWLGTGVGRGAVIALVHTLILTVYCWTLLPIGLPSQTVPPRVRRRAREGSRVVSLATEPHMGRRR